MAIVFETVDRKSELLFVAWSETAHEILLNLNYETEKAGHDYDMRSKCQEGYIPYFPPDEACADFRGTLIKLGAVVAKGA